MTRLCTQKAMRFFLARKAVGCRLMFWGGRRAAADPLAHEARKQEPQSLEYRRGGHLRSMATGRILGQSMTTFIQCGNQDPAPYERELD